MRSLLLFLLCIGGVFAQATLHTVQNTGPRSKRVNIVFLSEGYTAADMPNFASHVNTAVNYLFSREPWQQYRSYCNVFRIQVASNESGCDYGSAGVLRDTYFNTGFNTPSVSQLLTLGSGGSSKVYSLLNTHVPEYHMPIVLVNDTKYGGAGGSLSVASVNSSSPQIVEHEVGHSFANLADEYDVEYPIYTPAEAPNNTAVTTRELIKWNAWIEASTAIPTPETSANDSKVGLFEGSMYRVSGWYRPHNNSLMRSLNRPVGNVNREQFVKSIYQRVDPVESWTPSGTSFAVSDYQDLSFSVSPKLPTIGSLQTSWFVDGVQQVSATSPSFSVNSEILGNGSHTVKARVKDPTTFVRNDPSALLQHEVTWTINLTNQLPPTLAAWRTQYGGDNAAPAGDGFPNLVKYGLGVSGTLPIEASKRPSAGITTVSGQKYLTLTVPRRAKRTDVSYTAEVSGNLSSWDSGSGHTVVVEDSATVLVVRDASPIGATNRRAMRLKVSAP